MIANLRRPGIASRKISSLLLPVSANWVDRPVTLLPGRAKLATRPVPSGSAALRTQSGITDVACFDHEGGDCRRNNDIHFEPNELGGDFGEAFVASLSPAILDGDGTTLDPAKFAQSLHKGRDRFARGRKRRRTQEPYSRHLRGLRSGYARPNRG